MSAAPTKSQSFRSFSSLSFPTWGTQAATAATATSDGEPKVESEAERSSSSAAIANRSVGSRSSRQQRCSFSSLAPSSVKSVVEENPQVLRDAAGMEEKHPQPNSRREEVPAAAIKEVNGVEGEEEEVKRTWNLRPRKGYSGVRKNNGVFSPEVCGGGNGNGGGASEVKQQKSGGGMEPKSNRLRGIAAESPGLGVVERKNEKPRLWVALSRDEIEEDIFSMSGNRPSRRPRKRPKTMQKHLDGVFPGLCLVGLNADNFRIPDTPAKR